MAEKLRWAILATGSIARQFAEGLLIAEQGELVAVGSRRLETAEAFARQYGGTPYGSYAEAVADPKVDAVYIATPHHTHAEDTIMVASHGKGILCEKPCTLNMADTERALAAVRDAGVFFMEAFMYRCTPQTHQIRLWLEGEAIGEPVVVQSEFAWRADDEWTNFRNQNELGGGGLMDIGCYCVSFSRMVFGEEPVDGIYISQRNEKSVDWIGSGLLRFSRDRSATFSCGMGYTGQNRAVIYGSKGRIEVDDPWKQRTGSKLRLFVENELVSELSLGVSNAELYAHEADAVARAFATGQSTDVPWADTLGQAQTLDLLKASAGLRL